MGIYSACGGVFINDGIAYLVPIFVNTGSNNMSAALIYSFIITCSALLLLRYVAKQWLWVGTLVGAGFWWLISLN